jgi:hypothetical protein
MLIHTIFGGAANPNQKNIRTGFWNIKIPTKVKINSFTVSFLQMFFSFCTNYSLLILNIGNNYSGVNTEIYNCTWEKVKERLTEYLIIHNSPHT